MAIMNSQKKQWQVIKDIMKNNLLLLRKILINSFFIFVAIISFSSYAMELRFTTNSTEHDEWLKGISTFNIEPIIRQSNNIYEIGELYSLSKSSDKQQWNNEILQSLKASNESLKTLAEDIFNIGIDAVSADDDSSPVKVKWSKHQQPNIRIRRYLPVVGDFDFAFNHILGISKKLNNSIEKSDDNEIKKFIKKYCYSVHLLFLLLEDPHEFEQRIKIDEISVLVEKEYCKVLRQIKNKLYKESFSDKIVSWDKSMEQAVGGLSSYASSIKKKLDIFDTIASKPHASSKILLFLNHSFAIRQIARVGESVTEHVVNPCLKLSGAKGPPEKYESFVKETGRPSEIIKKIEENLPSQIREPLTYVLANYTRTCNFGLWALNKSLLPLKTILEFPAELLDQSKIPLPKEQLFSYVRLIGKNYKNFFQEQKITDFNGKDLEGIASLSSSDDYSCMVKKLEKMSVEELRGEKDNALMNLHVIRYKLSNTLRKKGIEEKIIEAENYIELCNKMLKTKKRDNKFEVFCDNISLHSYLTEIYKDIIDSGSKLSFLYKLVNNYDYEYKILLRYNYYVERKNILKKDAQEIFNKWLAFIYKREYDLRVENFQKEMDEIQNIEKEINTLKSNQTTFIQRVAKDFGYFQKYSVTKSVNCAFIPLFTAYELAAGSIKNWFSNKKIAELDTEKKSKQSSYENDFNVLRDNYNDIVKNTVIDEYLNTKKGNFEIKKVAELIKDVKIQPTMEDAKPLYAQYNESILSDDNVNASLGIFGEDYQDEGEGKGEGK